MTIAWIIASVGQEHINDEYSRSLHIETREVIAAHARPAEELIDELRRRFKGDPSRLSSARQSAAFLAQQIHNFLAQYPPPQIPQFPPELTQIELLDSPELIRFSQISHRYEFQLRSEYRERFQLQAMNVATELARAGEVDGVVLVLIHNIHVSSMLKMLADRLQVLSEAKP